MFRIDNETDAAEILELKRSNAEMMDMIRQMRSESAIGGVGCLEVTIAVDAAKAKAEEAIKEVAALREKLKELLDYEKKLSIWIVEYVEKNTNGHRCPGWYIRCPELPILS